MKLSFMIESLFMLLYNYWRFIFEGSQDIQEALEFRETLELFEPSFFFLRLFGLDDPHQLAFSSSLLQPL